MPAKDRLEAFLDKDSFQELDTKLVSTDPLSFNWKKDYSEKLSLAASKAKNLDAIRTGTGLLKGMPVQVGSFDFGFMGGSMGCVVGEKISNMFERSLENLQPAVLFSASGGARMQEGILSLMQMAKTCSWLEKLKQAGVPYVSVLTHPTTGGVAASFSMLGDVNIAEPNALIGFAGPRVISQTIRQELPEGFQRSEFLLEHGMVDQIVERKELPTRIYNILSLLTQRPHEPVRAPFD
jgi:acetyl-CoA carboxylase carboxyl transferase subunit beta